MSNYELDYYFEKIMDKCKGVVQTGKNNMTKQYDLTIDKFTLKDTLREILLEQKKNYRDEYNRGFANGELDGIAKGKRIYRVALERMVKKIDLGEVEE